MPNGMFSTKQMHGKQQMIAPVRAMESPERRASEMPPASCNSDSTNISHATVIYMEITMNCSCPMFGILNIASDPITI